jgi:hypothetical protein
MKPIKIKKQEKNIKDFAPIMTRACQGVCDREVLMTKEGPVVVCNGCMKILIDNRDKK